MSSVFDRYAPFVQDFIYSHEWEELRGIQVAAGAAIFDTDEHVLLTSSTASGKTEAAFFPMLSTLSPMISLEILLPFSALSAIFVTL